MSRIREKSSSGNWTPELDATSGLMIAVAYVIFFYFLVFCRYLEVFFKPASVMVLMLSTGIVIGMTFVGARIRMDAFSIATAGTGILAMTVLIIIQFVVSSLVPQSTIGAQGIVVELSPFWLVAFYFSVGIAEEALFTLSIFGLMVKTGINPWLAAAGKSVMFVAYHNAAAWQIFSKPIFQVTNYSIVLYVGSFFLTILFYVTRNFTAPALGHGLLNAYVQTVSLLRVV